MHTIEFTLCIDSVDISGFICSLSSIVQLQYQMSFVSTNKCFIRIANVLLKREYVYMSRYSCISPFCTRTVAKAPGLDNRSPTIIFANCPRLQSNRLPMLPGTANDALRTSPVMSYGARNDVTDSFRTL